MHREQLGEKKLRGKELDAIRLICARTRENILHVLQECFCALFLRSADTESLTPSPVFLRSHSVSRYIPPPGAPDPVV